MSKKKKAIIIVSSIVGTIVLTLAGGFLAFKIFNQVNEKEVDVHYEEKDVINDNSEAGIRYNALENKNVNFLEHGFNLEEIIYLSRLSTIQQNKFKIKTTGNAKAKVLNGLVTINQLVNASTIRNDNQLIVENISYSNYLKCADRFYYDFAKPIVDYYKGEAEDIDHASNYELTKSYSNNDEYKKDWGKYVYEIDCYIISSNTILESSTIEFNKDVYVVSLDLDPNKGSVNYITQMKTISSLTRDPYFENIHLDLKINKDLKIQSIDVDETYIVYKELPILGYVAADTNNIMNVTFEYGGDYQI